MTKVQVYRNLHKGTAQGAVYSVRDKATRLVSSHRKWLVLEDVRFHVGQRGRQRVLDECSKNVHAWVEGVVDEADSSDQSDKTKIQFLERMDVVAWGHELAKVTYDPYKYSSFVFTDSETPIHKARVVLITPKGVKVLRPLP